ncbi:methyltransferase [Gordonia phage Pytheas]|nr:methyltransferase [Gordonia Phage Jablanski]UYL88071.1 methyltransferase [Gordonia phage Pytheas]
MATGASGKYWNNARLPGIVKHGILRRYLPLYLARTSSYDGRAFVIDGYAGRGRYDDGSLGSAGMMLEWALTRKLDTRNPADYQLRFFEKDPTSFAHLSSLVREFASKGVDVQAECADVLTRFGTVVGDAEGMPLFLFIDPTGVGLPYEDLVDALTRPRDTYNWPPTELLMNFSYEAVRRIGGHVTSPHGNAKTLKTLDNRLGGDWWQEHFARGVSDDAVTEVVKGFITRLGTETGQRHVLSLPVRRQPHHKPVYSLVFATRSPRGAWHFSDVAAKSVDEARTAADDAAGALPLETLAETEAGAVADIEQNILDLVEKRGAIVVGDHPTEVLKGHLGEIRELVVRRAIKNLHKRGLTPSDGKGGKTENLVVLPNP